MVKGLVSTSRGTLTDSKVVLPVVVPVVRFPLNKPVKVFMVNRNGVPKIEPSYPETRGTGEYISLHVENGQNMYITRTLKQKSYLHLWW